MGQKSFFFGGGANFSDQSEWIKPNGIWMGALGRPATKKSPTHRTHERTDPEKTWVSIITRSRFYLVRGLLGFGPIQFLMDIS